MFLDDCCFLVNPYCACLSLALNMDITKVFWERRKRMKSKSSLTIKSNLDTGWVVVDDIEDVDEAEEDGYEQAHPPCHNLVTS